MMRRLVILTLVIVALLISVLVCVFTTEVGLSTSSSMLQRWVPALSIEKVTGRLNQSATLEGLVYRAADQQQYRINKLIVSLSPISLLSGRMTVDVLQLDGIELTLGSSAEKPLEDNAFLLADLALPIAFNIADLRVSNVSLINESSQKNTVFTGLSASLSASGQTLNLKQLTLQKDSEASLEIEGIISLNGTDPTHLNYRWRLATNAKPLSAEGQIKGNFADLTIEQQLLEPVQSKQTIKVTKLLSDFNWTAQAQLAALTWSDLIDGQPGGLSNATLTASGTKRNAKVIINSQLVDHALADFKLDFNANRDEADNWKINAQLLSSSKLGLTLVGYVRQPFKQPQLELEGNWQQIQWPVGADNIPLFSRKGKFSINGKDEQYRIETLGDLDIEQQQATFSSEIDFTKDRLVLKRFDLKGFGGQTTLSGEVLFNTENPVYQLQAKLMNLTVPRALSKALMVINKGDIELSGTIDAPLLNIQAELLVDTKPVNLNLTYQTDASGSNQLNMLASMKTARAQFNGTAQLNDLFRLNGVVKLHQVDPSLFAKDWPGTLSGGWQMSVNKRSGDGFDLNIKALTIDGTLRQRPLRVTADLSYLNGAINVTSLQISSAKSVIRAEGSLKDKLAFNWWLNSPNLADIHPDLTGQLHANGKLSGDMDTPSISTKLNGKNIIYTGVFQFDKVDSEVFVDMAKQGRMDVNIAFSALSLKGSQIIDGSLSMTGRTDQHNVTLKANDKTASVFGRASGGFTDQQWRGKFSELHVNQEDGTQWKAKKFGSIVLAKNHFQIDQQCLQAAQSAFCLQANYKEKGDWKSKFSLRAIPMTLVNAYTDFVEPLQGEINADIELNGQGLYPTGGRGQLNVQKARLLLDAETKDQKIIPLKQLSLSYQLSEKNSLIDLLLAPDIKGVSPLTGRLSLSDIKTAILDPDKSTVSGYLKTTVADLAEIDSLHDDYENLKGQLTVDIGVSGTVKKPLLNGLLALNNGHVELPRLGIKLEDVRVLAESDALNVIKLNYQLKSGQGQLIGEAELSNSKQGWNIVSTAKGKDVQVLNLPEAYVVASPDLSFALKNNASQLSGTVIVPIAELVPLQFNSPVSASDDVVVINGQSEKAAQSIATDFNVNITLGDKVKVEELGFDGRLLGKLLISGNSKKLLLGTGDIVIKEGSYVAYGQKLEVDNGKIHFTGGALDNPSLDIKAIRKSGKVTAGLQVTGTADEPLVGLFSSPTMSDDNILSYLMIGRPLASASAGDAAILASAATGLGIKGGNMLGEQIASTFGLDSLAINGNGGGDTALQIGKYLSPKLYLSYGIGLFEPVSTVKLNYELNESWSVKTESGVETEVDILYTKER
ncbi:MAG: translocation/assembly module TamB domain-containing protein [Cycloclasticus sp.]|nr:translocation/assembly module TamB domain-containing protein [Cycloclasticus sp.]